MIEALFTQHIAGVKIPPATSKTLFRLAGFPDTTAIKDTGPTGIAVTNSALTVGADDFATYMNFNGNAYLGIASHASLTRNDIDISFIIGHVKLAASSYGQALFDTRPVGSNGDGLYHLAGLDVATVDPVRLYLNYPATYTTYTAPQKVTTGLLKITIRLDSRGASLYLNDVFIFTNPTSGALRTNNLKIGLGAFKSAGVPNFNGRLYYAEINSLT